MVELLTMDSLLSYLPHGSSRPSLTIASLVVALLAATATLIRRFVIRPRKHSLPVFEVTDDVVKAVEDAHAAVSILRRTLRSSADQTVSRHTLYAVNGGSRGSGFASLRHRDHQVAAGNGCLDQVSTIRADESIYT